MSLNSQLSPTWRTLAKRHLRGRVLNWHQHRDAQLLYAVSGVMQVLTVQGQWTVPPQRAVWIPPGVAHQVTILSDVELRTLYLSASIYEDIDRKTQVVFAITTSILMRELILTLFNSKYSVVVHERAIALLLSLIPIAQELPNYLAMPSSPVLLRVALALLANRQWNIPVADIAKTAHMTERSFSRHFSAEVGMNFRAWRQRARIIASLDRIVKGESCKSVASMLCFNSPSAFIAAFKQVMGNTPVKFLDFSPTTID